MPTPSDSEEKQERPDNRPFLLSGFHRLTGLMNGVGTIWIFALVFMVCTDVAARALFNTPITGVPELVALSIVGIVYLELANTLRVHRFIRSDVIIGRLLTNRPRVGYGFQAVHHLIGGIVSGIILWFTFPRFISAWESDEFIGTLGDFTAPVWPVKLIIVLGTSALSLQFLIHAWSDLLVMAGRREPPQTAVARE